MRTLAAAGFAILVTSCGTPPKAHTPPPPQSLRHPEIRLIRLDAYAFPPRRSVYGKLSFYAPDRNVSRINMLASDGDHYYIDVSRQAYGKQSGTIPITVQCNGTRIGLVVQRYSLYTKNGLASDEYQVGFTCQGQAQPPRRGTPGQGRSRAPGQDCPEGWVWKRLGPSVEVCQRP